MIAGLGIYLIYADGKHPYLQMGDLLFYQTYHVNEFDTKTHAVKIIRTGKSVWVSQYIFNQMIMYDSLTDKEKFMYELSGIIPDRMKK